MILFGKEIEGRKLDCSLNGFPAPKLPERFNLYVRIRNRCNCDCKFCEFTEETEYFDSDKFCEILEWMFKREVAINKISFTGGEPSLDMNLLRENISVAKFVYPQSFLTVNTNGVNLRGLADTKGIDSIALSRHHYDEKINASIMGFSVPDAIIMDVISYLKKNDPHKSKFFHMSCNLIKGYIDSGKEIDKYMAYAQHLGVRDIGFVTLMTVNEFCKERQIVFDDLMFPDNFIRNKYWTQGENCRCANYLWRNPDDGNISKFYSRYYCKGSSVGTLVFDGKNLKEGFSGQIIF